MAKRRIKKAEENVDGFIATFADTMTLLLTFFILLYSMSSIEEEKLQQVASAMSEQLTGEIGPGISNIDVVIDNSKKPKEELIKAVNLFIEKENLQDKIEVRVTDKGVILQVANSLLFDSGSAEIKPASLQVLNKLGQLFATLKNEVIVEGHTDNVPTRGKYPSNWELSTARSVNVVKHFIEIDKMNPEQFIASGYGEYKPIAPNDTVENKSKNRRVDILIVQENDPIPQIKEVTKEL